MTLDEAIQQMINLGETDPRTIAEKLPERHDEAWLAAELLALSANVIEERARHRISAARRQSQIALRPGDQVSSAEMKARTQWIPNEGWIRVSDLTAAHLRALAEWYRRLAGAAMQRVGWCLEVVELMEAEGVQKLGKLKAALPALPELEEVTA